MMHSNDAESTKSGAVADNAAPLSGDEFLKSLGKNLLENWNTPIAAPLTNFASQNIQRLKPSAPESKSPVRPAGNPQIKITSAKEDDNDNDSKYGKLPAPQQPLARSVPSISLLSEPEDIEQPGGGGNVKRSSDFNETVDTLLARSLFGFARGESPCLWYKFKRFESLSLLNLYHLQDELVTEDEKISKSGGDVTREQILKLRSLLKEYRKGKLSTSLWKKY